MIELKTTRDEIRSVARRWHDQYFHEQTGWRYGDDKRRIYEALVELDRETASAEEVEKIAGNNSWTRITCDSCKRDVDRAVLLGENPDYESSTATVCGECLTEAVGLFNGSRV